MRRTTSVSLFALTTLLLTGSPALADREVGLSSDGVTWDAGLAEPLYDPGFRWVPGDERARSFFVRNESSDGARLSVDILGAGVDSLMDTGDLTVSARGDGGAWRDVSLAGTHRLVSGVDIGAGDTSRVDVNVAFDPASANPSQTRRLDLDFQVRLVQDGATHGEAGADDSLLPDTGGPALSALLVAVVLVVVGTALMTRRRAREVPRGQP